MQTHLNYENYVKKQHAFDYISSYIESKYVSVNYTLERWNQESKENGIYDQIKFKNKKQ